MHIYVVWTHITYTNYMDNKWIKLTEDMVAPFGHWVSVSSPQGRLTLIDDNSKDLEDYLLKDLRSRVYFRFSNIMISETFKA